MERFFSMQQGTTTSTEKGRNSEIRTLTGNSLFDDCDMLRSVFFFYFKGFLEGGKEPFHPCQILVNHSLKALRIST